MAIAALRSRRLSLVVNVREEAQLPLMFAKRHVEMDSILAGTNVMMETLRTTMVALQHVQSKRDGSASEVQTEVQMSALNSFLPT